MEYSAETFARGLGDRGVYRLPGIERLPTGGDKGRKYLFHK